MTLYKQLSFLVTLLLISIFIIVLGVNFKNSIDSVQEQLYSDAKNTATSLSLSLASANGNISMMSTMINANFDNGAYQEITLVDMQGELLYERHSENSSIDVPKWFMNLVPIKAPVASANVSAGWNPIGILNVQSSTSAAYTQLYKILYSLTISFSITFIISIAFLYLLLSILLKPLQNIRFQAEAISNNRFIIQEKLPYTLDFREVVKAMNIMVQKVEEIFNKANEALRRQSELMYKDEATGLYNRKYLINKLPEYLKIDAGVPSGICIMLAIEGAQEANRLVGRQKVDKLYGDIARMLKQHSKDFKNSIVVRMNGTEFFILLPSCSEENGISLAHYMSHASDILLSKELDRKVTYITFGVYEYHHKQSVSHLLGASDYALSQAKLVDKTHVYFHKAETTHEIMGKEEWRKTLDFAIEHNTIYFDTYKVIDTVTKKIIHNVLSISVIGYDAQKYPYGKFIAPAITLGLDIEIYKKAVLKIFKEPNAKLKGSTCSLRLSSQYLDDPMTFAELKHILNRYAKNLPFKLIIELPDKVLRSASENLQLYKDLFELHDIQIGIFEFIGESEDYTYLKELRPSYIKAEADYFLGLTSQDLSSLQVITDSIGTDLIATGVIAPESLEKLQNINIHKVQGHITEMLD
ncbi:LapD/MoxY N-terminal periplasmic domain-containing protein [Sulfurimonas sp. HSL-1716]|uniref:bifunctional diguanylate cyclase/phosphodiesterase n=1 Tax=Hydrocurvibacter sulfurireducens TaxID=3131937 RepID=UPI0031F87A73